MVWQANYRASVQGQCSVRTTNPDHCDLYDLLPRDDSHLRHIGGYKPPLSGVGERLHYRFYSAKSGMAHSLRANVPAGAILTSISYSLNFPWTHTLYDVECLDQTHYGRHRYLNEKKAL